MDYVDKPTEGFNTPYQAIVQKLAEVMISKQPNNDFDMMWFNKWNCLDERECDIIVPAPHQNNRFKTQISSSVRDINPISFTFNTLTVKSFFSSLFTYTKRMYGVGYHVTEPGFYFTSGSNSVVLVVRRGSNLSDGIRYQRCELPVKLYTISSKKDYLTLSCPVVKGDIPLIYL